MFHTNPLIFLACLGLLGWFAYEAKHHVESDAANTVLAIAAMIILVASAFFAMRDGF